jgi:hypothetical protein
MWGRMEAAFAAKIIIHVNPGNPAISFCHKIAVMADYKHENTSRFLSSV